MKILLLEGVSQTALDVFKHHNYTNIEYLKTSLSSDQLKEKIKDARFIGIRS
ncbi:MAG: phosphoglycerate dehydrogenase, partial [Thiotrichales bacterium]